MMLTKESYEIVYVTDSERAASIAEIQGRGHVVLHDHHYWKDTVDDEGRTVRTFERGVLVAYLDDPRRVVPAKPPTEPWDDNATVDEKLNRIAVHVGLKEKKKHGG